MVASSPGWAVHNLAGCGGTTCIRSAVDDSARGVQGDLDGLHFRYPPTAFTVAELGARAVPCLTARQQEVFHSGYRLRPQDEHDLRVLATLAGQPRRGGGNQR